MFELSSNLCLVFVFAAPLTLSRLTAAQAARSGGATSAGREVSRAETPARGRRNTGDPSSAVVESRSSGGSRPTGGSRPADGARPSVEGGDAAGSRAAGGSRRRSAEEDVTPRGPPPKRTRRETGESSRQEDSSRGKELDLVADRREASRPRGDGDLPIWRPDWPICEDQVGLAAAEVATSLMDGVLLPRDKEASRHRSVDECYEAGMWGLYVVSFFSLSFLGNLPG